ncbi:unnamed protein product [Paramecium sonneborni]|uniref:Uncharacterized protein n=1 Tax=Paramecium sonneborni TaxID=65129 RepID=A0A8S1PG70_9CILI|nr:unnamed protein product [Paramecium sonneborni]
MLKKKGSEQLDIIFEAGEDLLNFSKNQVIMIKNNSIKLLIIRPRTFLSYSLEFCVLWNYRSKLQNAEISIIRQRYKT